jgi:DNA-binding HxlR family transcriptional regulator
VKKILVDFNKAFESKVRLGIMSVLMVNEEADFNTLKELLNLSDGNLASHIKALEELKYITVNKQFIGRKPNTTYSATKDGKKAFNAHLKSLEILIKSQTN